MGTPAKFVWQASTARVVVVDGFGPFPRGTWQGLPPALAWPAKDPGDVLDYVVDLSRALAGDNGDAIATLDITISPANPGDIVLRQSQVDGSLAILWLDAGLSNTTYAITVAVTTNSGRKIVRTIGLSVETLSSPTPFGVNITDQSGVAITDQSGSPISVS